MTTRWSITWDLVRLSMERSVEGRPTMKVDAEPRHQRAEQDHHDG
jgi:hypothetical protein